MKKSRALILISVLMLLVFAFCACEMVVPVPDDGLSAYDIAVKHGFVGTEEEWLASLRGTDGKDGRDGVDGTNGIDGKDGLDGKDGESGIIEQPVNQTITNNEITINGEATDVRYASGVALKSAVCISCAFTDKVTLSSYGSAGAGVIYELEDDGSAFIITNHHVVYDADCNTSNKISNKISVFIYGMEYADFAIPATYVGGSMTYDIAVLRIEKSDILKSAKARGVACPVSIDAKASVGEAVIAVGNPEGEGFSVTSGIINVLSEEIEMDLPDGSGAIDMRVMRTDTAVNGGNSGGGLFDASGKLLGIVNAKLVKEEVDNIGYAIPISLAQAIAENIIDFCFETDCETVMRPLLGIEVYMSDVYTEYNTETGELDIIEENKVNSVSATGIANGKLVAGDIIKSITVGSKTTNITRQFQFIEALMYAREGDIITVVVDRPGILTTTEKTLQITVTDSCFNAEK
ncbi:MAG: serine protease [Clostridia bacterium]|nr:serine protease [Clostridia bacterium]